MIDLKRLFLVFSLFVALPVFGAVPFDFFTAVKNDTVVVLTNRTLRSGENLIVERKSALESEFVRLTETPIEADMDPFSLRQKLGNVYPLIEEAVDSSDPQSTLLALRTDAFFGTLFSLLDRNVATILGRYFAAKGHQSGETFIYRVILSERDGTVLATKEHSVVIRETPPKTAPVLSVKQEGNRALVSWEYPDWSGDRSDLVIRFRLERKEAGGAFLPVADRIFPRIGSDFYHYTDESVLVGKSYTYRIRAVDVVGLAGPPSPAVEISLKDIVSPSKPTGLEAEVNGKTVQLTWNRNPESDLSHYDVYRMHIETADSIRINPVPIPPNSTLYVDNTLVYKHTYYYSVVAIDSSGNTSTASDAVHVLATDTTPPESPTELAATVNDRSVTLSWNPVVDNDLAGYRVSRSMNDQTFFPIHEELVLETRYFDPGPKGQQLQAGRSYFYAVKAVDSLANTSQAVGIWVAIPDDEPPLPAGQVTVHNRHGRYLEISWNPSPSRDVSLYRVLRRVGDSEVEIGSFPETLRAIQDDSVVTGQMVVYSVTAVDSAGNASEAKFSYPETLRDFDPPPFPRFVEAVRGDQGVIVQWDPIGSTDLAGYFVFRSDLPTGIGLRVNTLPVQGNMLIDPDGTTAHWYWVTAVDVSGNEGNKSKAVPVQSRP